MAKTRLVALCAVIAALLACKKGSNEAADAALEAEAPAVVEAAAPEPVEAAAPDAAEDTGAPTAKTTTTTKKDGGVTDAGSDAAAKDSGATDAAAAQDAKADGPLITKATCMAVCKRQFDGCTRQKLDAGNFCADLRTRCEANCAAFP